MLNISNMQFHGYLETLVGSRTAIRLLQTLVNYQGKVFTVRKLADAAKVSASEAAAIVQQLEKFGVLKIQPVGKSYLLTLNESSYILEKVLRPMIRAEKDTLQALISTLNESLRSNVIKSAHLFGSVAAKQERPDSDIDLLVISDDFDAATALVAKAQEKVSLLFNSRLSALIMTEKELAKKKDDRLVQSILGNYITVAGPDLKETVG
jgi:predicted nucleotidyltransferase